MDFNYQNPKRLFHGQRIDVFSIDSPHPKGGLVKREIVAHPGAVVILPFLDEATILLIRNERPAILQTLWELPAGTLDEKEDKEYCAYREIEEETGYLAKKMTYLFEFFSSPGFCNELITVFVAENLSFVGQRLDETEKIEVFSIPFTQALAMIMSHEISDAKTIAALLYYHFKKENFM